MEDLSALQEKAREIGEKIGRIEDAARFEENKQLEGKAFKYRNNYSCPEKLSDYWWLYIKVTKVTRDHIWTHQFQIDKYGEITVNLHKSYYRHLFGADSRIEISRAEFDRAWKALQAKIKTHR